MKITIISMILFLLLGYTPPSPPVLTPDDIPFLGYDPNMCASPPIAALILPIGVSHDGSIKVSEPEGEDVVLTLSKGEQTWVVNGGSVTVMSVNDISPFNVAEVPYYDEVDVNDISGRCRIRRYKWSWTPDANDIGIHYVNITATDPVGNFEQRTMVILVEENKPPVIGGCE